MKPLAMLPAADDDTITLDERKFVEVVGFDIPVGMLDRGPLDGAYGASVVDVKIGRKVEGAMIITVIDHDTVRRVALYRAEKAKWAKSGISCPGPGLGWRLSRGAGGGWQQPGRARHASGGQHALALDRSPKATSCVM
jgi:hypothetical protein